MSPKARVVAQLGILVAVLVGLAIAFPRTLRFVEMAARELRYFWWVILVLGLAAWLIWGVGRKRRDDSIDHRSR